MSKTRLILFGMMAAVAMFLVMRMPTKKEAEVIPVQDVYVDDDKGRSRGPDEPEEENGVQLEITRDDSYLPPEVNRMAELFNPRCPRLPIVETVTYSSRVPWLDGRLAFLGDYASKYKTSKHFISASLHGMGNYLSDKVANGNCFNVLREDKQLEFHLVLDISRTKLWVYYYDVEENARCLLKSYPVCCGKLTSRGSLTPTGVYALSQEIAVYKEGMVRTVKNTPLEMVTVFGTRWIPFGEEIANCSASGRGVGIHGTPWARSEEGLVENRECIGNYESEGCVRLLTEDIEELFALIVSRPSYIHCVQDFADAHLPGKLIEL